MDESKNIQLAKNGDLAAFNRLVMAHQGIAYNVAYRIMGDADAAADACQEAFISAYKGIGKLRGGSFRSWVLRIVTNACYDNLRYERRRPAASLEEVTTDDDQENADHSPLLADDHDGPEEIAMRRELSDSIQKGISSLPPDQRTVIVLADVQGFSYQEVAEITESSLGTVKSRLSRARAKLRDHLMEQSELLPGRYRLSSAG